MLRGRPIMKRLVAAMACGAVIAGGYSLETRAQAPKATPAAVAPAAAAPTPGAPAAAPRAVTAPVPPAAAAPAAKAVRHAKKQTWTRADARVCLEFPTNPQ